MTPLGLAATLYYLLSRVAYAGGVGVLLTLERTRHVFTARGGPDAGYRRFKRIAAILMNHDGVAFVALAVLTAGTLGLGWNAALRVGLGALLCAAGIAVKVWAARTLGSAGYHWRDFFLPHLEHELVAVGPYRWLKNPMYTVGYLQTYGLALIVDSWPALAGAAFAQATILAFYVLVEKPNVDRIAAGTPLIAPRKARETLPARRPPVH